MRIGKFKINHYINYMVIGLITLVMGTISLVGGHFDNSLIFLMEKIAISIILAVSLSLVVGFLGELSLGHAGFMCVGAYLGGKVASLLVPVLGDGIMYRSDLMDELGMEAPTTIDEFYNMLVAVKAKWPDMIPYANTSLNSNRMKDAFGMWAEFGVKDGKVVSNYDANIKEYLTFMNKLYTEGLLDVESAYQTSAQRREKIVAGKIFAWDDGVWSKEMRQAWAASGTPYKAEFLPELANTEWFVEADMSTYISFLIATLNHDRSLSKLLNPYDRIHALIKQYNNEQTLAGLRLV